MTIHTTNGETFDRVEHRALANLMFKRFGRDEVAFCDAWRRMLQNTAENGEIMALVHFDRRDDQSHLKRLLVREGFADARQIRVDLLDETSCRVLARLVKKVKDDGERQGQRQVGKAIARGFIF